MAEVPKNVAMTVWLPKYDSSGRDAAWRKETGSVTRRESGSRGGFCGMEVIHRVKVRKLESNIP
jgi:hypothetical protein